MPDITIRTQELFDLSHTAAAALLEKCEFPWQALPDIGGFIKGLGQDLPQGEYDHPEEFVWIHRSAIRFPNNYIAGPCIVGPNTEIRPGAFIRGNALIGAGCVVGNSTELKNVILFDNVQVPHYNYVGDSILGYKSHMGAAALTSNVKQDKSPVAVRLPDGTRVETGLKKFGAILGDHVEIGCGTVLNPGSVIGRESRVYPLSMVRGAVPTHSIYKKAGEVAGIRAMNE